ncbi:MAG: membrane protein insertase YidC [Myxococcota bacterium]|nr:membrane protein insertase YidC [Myxococcota bacterium]
MEESENNQRILRATILSVIVLTTWTYLFPQKPPKKNASVATTEKSENVQTATTATMAGEVTTTTVAKAPRKVIPESIEKFSGSVDSGDEKIPYSLQLTNVGGGIQLFELPSFKERDADNQPTEDPIRLAQPNLDAPDLRNQMAGIQFLEGTTFRFPLRPVYEVRRPRENQVIYSYKTDEGIEVERIYDISPDSFEIEMAVTVRNNSDQPQRHVMEISTSSKLTEVMEEGGMMFMPPPDHLNGACFTDGSVEREAQKELVSESEKFSENVKWVGMDRQYFLSAIIHRDDDPAECRLTANGQQARAALVMAESTLRPGEEKRHKFTAYLGVKKPKLLTRSEAQLESAVDYTIMGLNLAILCEGLLAILALIYGLSGSWGIAILGLTVLVKLALFPLNQRSGRSMRAMSKLKPQIDALKEKFPDDRQRQSEEMMKLYRDHNVSPASGCVPMLIQMPIWFALYRALWVSIDLYQESFLWIPDLTSRDPYWILPAILVVVMFLQQKMTPTTMDAAQQKMMMYFMPIMFGAMMIALPAGLCFYIFVNTVLTIVQQHFINKDAGTPPAAAALSS